MTPLRTLWTMKRPRSRPVVAGIFNTPFGHELRIMLDDDPRSVIESLRSPTDDSVLEARATHVRRLLESGGWRDVTTIAASRHL